MLIHFTKSRILNFENCVWRDTHILTLIPHNRQGDIEKYLVALRMYGP